MDAALPRAPHRTVRQLMDHLALADPQAAQRMSAHLADGPSVEGGSRLAGLVDAVIEALAVELTFGRALADGIGRMLISASPGDLDRYLGAVNAAAARGPTLAALFARHLVPVLACGDRRLVDRFDTTTRTMLRRGTYTLKAPLEALGRLIAEADLAGAHALLDLLEATYTRDLSYNRTVYLTHTLPRAVGEFDTRRRGWQIRGLTRIIATDESLADDYLQGMAAGLHLLSATALDGFLDHALRRYQEDPASGRRFLALASRRARSMCRDLQVAVPLPAVRPGLERYLHARTGLAVAVRPLSERPPTNDGGDRPLVSCDGRRIYLADEMDVMDARTDNAALYKLLVRLEIGAIEFGTFDLDAEKALPPQPGASGSDPVDDGSGPTDLQRFLARFDDPGLALDLFTVFEHGRIARRTGQRYPGLARRLEAALTDRRLIRKAGRLPDGTLLPIYRHLVQGERLSGDRGSTPLFRAMAQRAGQAAAAGDDTVETSARLALEFYPRLADRTADGTQGTYRPLRLAFGRRYDPSRFAPFESACHRLAVAIRARLAERRLHAYRSDIQALIARRGAALSRTDLTPLITPRSTEDGAATVDLAWLDVASLVCRHGLAPPPETAGGPAFRYREWDGCLGDYLPDRVRVLERDIDGRDPRFYTQTLDRFHGLARRIRYAFELMRPEEMTILRQWREGDAFDYRALLDYAVDRKAGRMPSDRLFIKRMKRVRDVAALLLVDLSRSTANVVDDRGTRVLDVERQAIVLLCEALRVVGDRFAIAGFSGTGPLGVDYYRIKDMDAPLDDGVRGRIGAMAPQRSTRMGAALRHATARMAKVQARVRLILVLGDGYPNDLEYKGAYAVEDTRRAVMEARAAGMHVKAITVNVCGNGQLDRLYGRPHHTLIGNVHDLPDKLVRVYSTLTRQ